jgi:hypothetical protein
VKALANLHVLLDQYKLQGKIPLRTFQYCGQGENVVQGNLFAGRFRDAGTFLQGRIGIVCMN